MTLFALLLLIFLSLILALGIIASFWEGSMGSFFLVALIVIPNIVFLCLYLGGIK